MKFLIAFVICVVCTMQAQADQNAIVLEQNSVVNPDGTYSYVWRTSNGINAEESGIGGVSAQGSYDFVSDDGVPVSIQYTADENGYRATGDAIPQPPAIPEYILRALEYINNNPPSSK
ncbi:CLUMA_CG021335, isoform A [Clunio marinus]|uniref:CLUMA_CG021335, isoform A n=1 Tax=Clunio marinus TaxID=568069 RepID=A0A1J1JAF6_9DIPT|nr:CLUMA_CG021335, isoform A [Clunio marinus]